MKNFSQTMLTGKKLVLAKRLLEGRIKRTALTHKEKVLAIDLEDDGLVAWKKFDHSSEGVHHLPQEYLMLTPDGWRLTTETLVEKQKAKASFPSLPTSLHEGIVGVDPDGVV